MIGWREGLFKQLAKSYEGSLPKLLNEVERSSYTGGRKFEKELARVFEGMGFQAEHDGRSGQKDVLVVASVGRGSYDFTVEAKGSKNAIQNADADVSAAASHRDRVGAEHAIIVARKFAGFQRLKSGEMPALYEECKSTGRVSIMETEALAAIYMAIMKFSYPLTLLRGIFTTLEIPEGKLKTVESLDRPGSDFDYRSLLEQIWNRQAGAARGDVVPYLAIFQDGPWKKGGMDFEDFERKLVALDTLAAGRIAVYSARREVYLRQSPDLILAHMEQSLQGKGHAFVEHDRDAEE